MKRLLVLLVAAAGLSACGSSAQLKTVQHNQGVQQTEAKVAHQVQTCFPSDPLLLSRGTERAKFASCTGVAKHARAFEACAVKVILGGLPTIARLEKGLTVCVEKAA